jgi:hypothetical protein
MMKHDRSWIYSCRGNGRGFDNDNSVRWLAHGFSYVTKINAEKTKNAGTFGASKRS